MGDVIKGKLGFVCQRGYRVLSRALMINEIIRELNQLVDQVCSIDSLFNQIVNQSMNGINQSTKSIESVNRSNYGSTKLINRWLITKKRPNKTRMINEPG